MTTNNEDQSFFSFLSGLIKDRVGNPITSALCVSWLIINYKVVFILFSDEKIVEKFRLIEFLHKGYLWGIPLSCWYYYIGPVLTTIFYVIGYPWLTQKVYRLHLRLNKKLLNIKKEIVQKEEVDSQIASLKDEKNRLESDFRETKESNEEIVKKKDEMLGLREAALAQREKVLNYVYSEIFDGYARQVFHFDYDSGDNGHHAEIEKIRNSISKFPGSEQLRKILSHAYARREVVRPEIPIFYKRDLDDKSILSSDEYDNFIIIFVNVFGVFKIKDDFSFILNVEDSNFDQQLAFLKKILSI